MAYSSEFCTKNEDGLFEVSWEEESFWRKLFRLPTKKVYVCRELNCENYEEYKGMYASFSWTDEDGKEADYSARVKINQVLNSQEWWD